MKFINPSIVAAAVMAHVGAAATKLRLSSAIQDINITAPSLNITIDIGVIDILQSNDLWTPNITAFANGDFNISAGVNFTAEEQKFNQSGLDINDLITVTLKTENNTNVAEKEAPNGYGVDCGHCHLCEEACVAAIWCLPCWGICEGVCQAQSWCHHCDHL